MSDDSDPMVPAFDTPNNPPLPATSDSSSLVYTGMVGFDFLNWDLLDSIDVESGTSSSHSRTRFTS